MIKKIDAQNQKTPSAKKMNSYSNKGSVAYAKQETFVANTKPKPGMGKGKSKGVGAAEFGTKFSGVY